MVHSLCWPPHGWPGSSATSSRPSNCAPPSIAGWIILLLSLLLMAVTRSQDIPMIEVATQIPVLLGCLLLIGGWPLARIFAFPLAFLIFSMPPPNWLLDAFTVPLKVWISDIVSNSLYDLGYPVAQNGVMIMIGSYELMVKDACSGMNSIFALSAIGIFYIHEFVSNHPIRKVLLILSIIPITILANVFRVVTLVLGAYYIGVDTIEGLFHDMTGIALFVFALALFFLLDRVLIASSSWLRRRSDYKAREAPREGPATKLWDARVGRGGRFFLRPAPLAVALRFWNRVGSAERLTNCTQPKQLDTPDADRL